MTDADRDREAATCFAKRLFLRTSFGVGSLAFVFGGGFARAFGGGLGFGGGYDTKMGRLKTTR